MKLILGVPVIGQHEITEECLHYLAANTSTPSELHVILIDNASDIPYDQPEGYPFEITLIRNEKNIGFYRPLLQVIEFAAEMDIVALQHNDVLIYEENWDERLREAFASDEHLGMVGFCGSFEADKLGGRGTGTMCYFDGAKGQSQAAGLRIADLRPAVLLDSLFLAMRPIVTKDLDLNEATPLAHFIDRIWPMQAMENGWKVAVLGIRIDHLGGVASKGIARAEEIARYDKDATEWCLEQGIDPGDDGPKALYEEAERRWLSEYRDQKHLIPSKMRGWDLVRA